MPEASPPVPDLYAAEPIPAGALDALAGLIGTGDLFRYGSEASPVARLEAEFAALVGARFALAVSSCSAALFLALRALGLPPGARVLLPAFTFAAVPSAVLHAGLVPVLAECGGDLRLDLGDVAAKVGFCDALLVSHMRGHTSDMDALLALAGDRPVIEDAAHSLGTTWTGRPIGTLGRMGCFSFQSYKLVNAGEGGMLVSDDPDLIARAVVMSGAYEHNWRKHPVLHAAFAGLQNRLPLYNMRLSNLAAAVVRPQLPLVAARARDGRRNHDRVAARLAASPCVEVPQPLPPEVRAPDSIQVLLRGMDDAQVGAFVAGAAARGLPVQCFGATRDNARAFWNWGFLGDPPPLPRTRAMLARACDLRLPARLSPADCDRVADLLLDALAEAAAPRRAFGT